MKKTKLENVAPRESLNILVIDDDPTFRKMVESAAGTAGVSVTVAGSFGEISPTDVARLYDVVILDYYLDNIRENLTGTDIAYALESTPILMTSATEHAVLEDEAWPVSVRKFVSKKKGARGILAEARRLVDRA